VVRRQFAIGAVTAGFSINAAATGVTINNAIAATGVTINNANQGLNTPHNTVERSAVVYWYLAL